MRYFVENFEKLYNKENPFGFFPDWEHYKSTGTHIGTDFKVPIGTPIFAPAAGEIFKTEINQYKGNVGIYIFDWKGTTWGLELCHLKELPQKGIYKEGDVIAHSGNTGGATTGAHLHAVLHRDAQVTKHYQLLISREAFLKLESEGAIVDCLEWFCSNTKEEIKSEPLEVIEIPSAVTSIPQVVPVLEENKNPRNFIDLLTQILERIISTLKNRDSRKQ
jgi:hypothetical protein